MKRVVVDASAYVAIAFNEPKGKEVAGRLEGVVVYAPTLLRFELANAAWKKARRHPAHAKAIARALELALDTRAGINWKGVDPVDTVLISLATGLTAYDSAYVALAGRLGADLVTLDEGIAAACALASEP
jgi:predicted nucleic acid-binding protein